MKIKKLILVGLLSSIASMHAQAPPAIPIDDRVVAMGLENALRSNTYQNRLNGVYQLSVQEEKQNLKSYDMKMQQAFILTLLELFNQRLKDPANRTNVFINFLRHREVMFSKIIDDKNPKTPGNDFWNMRILQMILNAESNVALTPAHLESMDPPGLKFKQSLVNAVKLNAQYGLQAESSGSQAITGGRSTRRSPPKRGGVIVDMNAYTIQESQRGEKVKDPNEKMDIAWNLVRQAKNKTFTSDAQNAFGRLLIDIFNNRGKIRNVKRFQKLFDNVLYSPILAINQKTFITEKMLPHIKVVKRRKRVKKARKKKARRPKVRKRRKKVRRPKKKTRKTKKRKKRTKKRRKR